MTTDDISGFGPGDIIIIPGKVPHWWSSLDSDIKYVIYARIQKAFKR